MRLRDVLVRQPSACPRSWGLDLTSSGSKCPVIFMTANDDEGTRDEAVDAGCIAYLRKPFARHALLNAVSVTKNIRSPQTRRSDKVSNYCAKLWLAGRY